MLTIYTRPFSDEEIKIIEGPPPSRASRIERIVTPSAVVSMMLFAVVWMTKYRLKFSDETETILLIAVAITSILLVIFVRAKFIDPARKKKLLEKIAGQADVMHIVTNRAIERKDPEDFGVAFYFDVLVNNERKTLYLWGQYLDMLVFDQLFPNTEFEIVHSRLNKKIIDLKVMGKHFLPEKVLPPFSKEVWETGKFPGDGQLLDITIDEVK
jgi:hypothetical protein